MKRSFYLLVSALIVLNAATGCMAETSQSEKSEPTKNNPVAAGYNGTVVETMNTAGYTYVQVDTGKEKILEIGPIEGGKRAMSPPRGGAHSGPHSCDHSRRRTDC